MAARKKKVSAKKTPRKSKAKKVAAPKRSTSRKAKKTAAAKPKTKKTAATKRKPTKTKRKARSNKTSPKNIIKNIKKLQDVKMDDVKRYIANIDVIDKLEELLLSLEQQIAKRLKNQKIIRKIT
jgi:hypothetical protein